MSKLGEKKSHLKAYVANKQKFWYLCLEQGFSTRDETT